jgi:ribonuclease T
MPAPGETFISVDIETAGPYPERYALLSIGACLVEDPATGFYIELKPVKGQVMESALRLSQLSIERLVRDGMAPALAMKLFTSWIRRVTAGGQQPLMVGFNVPSDWAFLNHYFLEYLRENPFGQSAIDIRALCMGLTGCRWEETSMLYLSPRFLKGRQLPDDALAAARLHADLFRKLLRQSRAEAFQAG